MNWFPSKNLPRSGWTDGIGHRLRIWAKIYRGRGAARVPFWRWLRWTLTGGGSDPMQKCLDAEAPAAPAKKEGEA